MRLSFVDETYAHSKIALWQLCLEQTQDLILREPTRLRQSRSSSVATDNIELSLFRYAAGEELVHVRAALTAALTEYIRVFALYGNEESGFPVIDLSDRDIDEISENTIRDVLKKAELDRSLTGSSPALTALHVALIADTPASRSELIKVVGCVMEMELAGQSQHWSNKQEVFIVQWLMRQAHDKTSVAIRVPQKPASGDKAVELWHENRAINALARNATAEFLPIIDEWLVWNEARAKDESNLDRSQFYYSMAALACCAIGLELQVVRYEQLPHDNIFLPLDLLARPQVCCQGRCAYGAKTRPGG